MTNQQADPLSPTTESERQRRIRGNRTPVAPGYLEVVIIAALVVAGGLFTYDRYFAPKISVIDMVGYVREQKALLAKGSITAEQLSENLKRLDDELKSLPSNQTVILKDVVLNNGRFDEISLQ